MKKTILAVILLALSNVAYAETPVANNAVSTHTWKYEDDVDKLRGAMTKLAMLDSVNSEAKNGLSLILRNGQSKGFQDEGFKIYFSIDGNIIPCSRGCNIKTKFDDGAVKEYEMRGSDSMKAVFFYKENYSRFVQDLKKSSRLIVEVDTYSSSSQFEFNVSGFDIDKLKLE